MYTACTPPTSTHAIMSKLEITNMVMVQNPETDEVVVIDRRRSWCGIAFPGGHAEDGESIYDSAVREIWEETGLEIRNLKACGFMYWFNKVTGDRYFTYFYKTTDYSGELIEGTEEGSVFWAKHNNLPGMKLAPHMLDYLKMFDEGIYSEAYCAYSSKDDQIIFYR